MARGFAPTKQLSTVVLLAASAYAVSEVCCNQLTTALSESKVFKPSDPNYAPENQKYWSSTAVLTPACVFVPESSSDVATAVKILVKNKCQFGTRGGGHTANPGWAGTDSGVLISLSKLTAVEVSEDKQSVVVGAGNRWGNVYAKTGEHNVTVTGGRISSVGVSGFLLGGGLSYLMQTEGFGANNVISYEMVLADGTLATITKDSAGDLFKALKGGSGNFGIATSFKLRTFPVNYAYAGNLLYTPDQYDKLFPIMETYARQGVESDLKTHVISSFAYFPSQNIDLASFYSFYPEPVTEPPAAIKPFFDVPPFNNTVQVKTVKDAADELGQGLQDGLRQDMRTFSIRPNAGLYKQLFDIWHSTSVTLSSTPGWFASLSFQVISNNMITESDKKGGNVLGLKPGADPLIIINYQFTWTSKADDKKVYSTVDKIMADSMNIAKKQNLLEKYLYLNYASSNQRPIESYGPDQVEFLRKVKTKYDPNRVFEKLSRGVNNQSGFDKLYLTDRDPPYHISAQAILTWLGKSKSSRLPPVVGSHANLTVERASVSFDDPLISNLEYTRSVLRVQSVKTGKREGCTFTAMSGQPSVSAKLFQPLQVGDITLQHRVILAPLTRFRANEEHVHQNIAADYYEQRAEVPGTLLITEATFIAAEAGGYKNVPGIWSEEQILAWKNIVDRVHAKGSYIYLQLWAIGRAAEPEVIHAEGYPYVSSSPTLLEDRSETPKELTKEDIKRYVGLYVQAAKNAVYKAGFDGVEIHCANGYLPEQFLQDTCNKRTDEYGGSMENRARFVLEITDAVVEAVGVKKTGIRFSPWSRFLGMRMKDPIPTFSYVLQELVKRHPDLAYVHFVESVVAGDGDADPLHKSNAESNDFAREIWGNRPFFIAGGFKLKTALEVVEKHEQTAVAFGRLFIANPDLPTRLYGDLPLNAYNRATFYTPGAIGYTDYPKAQKVEA